MWVADMDFPSPPVVVDALPPRVEHGFFGYLAEHTELPEIVADRLNKRYGWRVSPEAVMPLPGVIAGFNLALRALTLPGDGLLVQTPVYPPILRSAGNHGLRPRRARADANARRPLRVDRGRFAAAISDRTRVFLLCNPHNPVGRLFEPARARGHGAACLRRDLWIVADEIHCELPSTAAQHVPIASLAPEIEQRTITLMAPSKTFNLPGLKCAVGIIPNAALRERLHWPPRAISCRRSTCSATPPPSPPTARASLAGRAARLSHGQPRLPRARAAGSPLPGVTMAPRGDLPGLARLPGSRASRRRPLHVLSRPAPRSRSTTA